MRVLYGVVGEGMGHATRSKVVIAHLLENNHRVRIVVSGRAYHFLKKHFDDVVEIQGLSITYDDGAMDRDRSVLDNMMRSPAIVVGNAAAYFERVVDFAPQLVISDFDSFAYLYAKAHATPVISIDNQQIIHRCEHEEDIRKGVDFDFFSTKAFVKAKLPGCDHYFITSFFFPKIRGKHAKNTTLVPPILRPEILNASSSRAKHILVYQTSVSDTSLIPTLRRLSDHQFIIYGLRRNEVQGNCIIKDFSEDQFIRDLSSARAVVSNGGLSLIHEAIYLRKPVFSVPIRHQFEQEMNARYLEKLGYGLGASKIEFDVLSWFLQQEDRYFDALGNHHQDGNRMLFEKLDEVLDRFDRP
ncbi:MAG TPA: glycosyltransferase family protein, partial [Polyangiaceae bacterium]|jgi:uncharacterized protein (TIGR00661 family)|nr:MAG: hypothetical protein BWY17_02257 [Deltaproteobacteria bacterium ADurb.Bin207]HNS99355.1 glycosyltransferase family protein [Polyangiaceae bacterium]HNZ24394.1 glycosyltransferase family protein [Polyangiaceae bacterium]HOD22584.1 glycosyltransferase family protein [Polyangiaceae bacterium]HOE51055.1 glycosyltransferase family protein [Polyangiaceae bacterium]